ncbi:acyltransferase family protein [Nocardioides lianchengensis]|uniref:acyltransferase family protein n=1 Tax=Nocardioides lianchengensis TaxID=1045774 RepID=UPI00147C89C7|nr:acyltransferase family protein [Nocardioides lianchengensis]NYG11500.1 peptidoglycan/LPS O-acetylase OafA/YrhL [Nocardioides lianchengensis]
MSAVSRHRESPATSKGFRPDIEGLRAVAVLSVLIYHAGLAWVPGGYVGVDVFFVISGFLITSLMVREVERRGRLGLADFWARRARRLLPASTLALVFSAVVALVCLPVNNRKDFGGDIVSAALYVVNWRLGAREVDYLAENVGSSPVQHYWSLAVEEQFYVVWPLLIAAVVALARARWRTGLLVTITAISVASFVFSLSYAVAQPGLAFFVSTTRIWELGVGALLAIAFPTLVRLPSALRAVLGWAGLALIAYSVLELGSTTVWPGTATLMPVLGTAAAILAGGGLTVRWGPGLLLGLRPAVWIGGLSYSLYLWHWPFLVAAEGLWGHLRVREGLLVVLASAIPAWLSYRYVETPFRHLPRFALPRPALLAGAAGMAVSTVAGLALVASFSLVDTVDEASADEAIGARALQDPRFADTDWAALRSVDAMRPSPLDAYTDYPGINTDGCVVKRETEAYETCEYGDPDAERTVVLVGDSKAAQWFSPVRTIAEDAGWRLVVVAKNGCPFAASTLLKDNKRNPSCESWQPWALQTIEDLDPDVVVTVTRHSQALPPGGTSTDDYTQAAMVDGIVEYWEQLVGDGITVVPILDTPPPVSATVPDCVQEHLDDLTQCVSLKERSVPRSGAPRQLEAARRVPEVRIVDMSDVLCPDGVRCPPVIGNVLVYRGGSHLTDTYARSATSALSARLARATDGLLGSA